MSNAQPLFNFQFVNSTVDAPTVPRDLAVRALIRKQAMKKAAATRKMSGSYGKHNLRQYPVFVEPMQSTPVETQIIQEAIDCLPNAPGPTREDDTTICNYTFSQPLKPTDGKESRSADSHTCLAILALSQNLPATLSATGYELSSMKSDFDILDLSTLTSMFAGRAARAALSQDPRNLIHQLRARQQWSYLSYLPQLYGHYPCLNAATDCVVARARQIMSPHGDWEGAVIALYVRALDALQKALDDPQQRYTPEVLCATEILSLYELLDPMGERAWIQHSAGAAKLIQVRGPSNYTSDFEKALFLAHSGAIMTECLINNERCFLEEKRWQSVFRSLIVHDDFQISDRSEITIHLIMLKAYVPGLYHDATSILFADTLPNADAITNLIVRVRRILHKISEWHSRYVAVLSCYPKFVPGSAEYDSNSKVYSTYLVCIMAANRLLGSLSSNERPALEERTQKIAEEVMNLSQEVRAVSKQTCLFLAQGRGTAMSVRGTKDDWEQLIKEDPQISTHEGRLLVRSHWREWCSTVGRKMPTTLG